ncbi:MAG: hypothetical protein J1E29_04145 [Duncaniella sp.]|nr:hypothetical protein [Duncaniella sp.]
MENKIKNGVNYDYIVALINRGDKVAVEEFAINRHYQEMTRALELLEDETADACDVYNAISKCLFSNLYTYCLAHEYTDSYINPISPVDFDYFSYRKLLNEAIELRVANKLKLLSKDVQNKRDKIEEARKSAWEDLYYKIYKTKKKLVDAALPYIYAYDYENALINYNIAENSIIFSHERCGDQRNNKFRENNIEHKINDDISVKISTNFCFGSSSYFHVTVIYKGIALLPYSVWVRYYYAGYSQLLGCTRSYKNKRESWHNCMNFLEKFINSALQDPDSFIHNEVMYEINGLIEGLEEIFNYDEEKFEKELLVKERPGDERYIGIIGVWYALERDEQQYKIAPKEISMIYKMEKISGALRFLDSLRKIKEIYAEVSDVIERIIEMNRLIYPQVEAAIPPVEQEIRKLNSELQPLERRLNSCELSFARIDNKLQIRIKGVFDKEEKRKIKETFEKNNPKYIELRDLIDNLRSEKYDLENKIRKREEVLKKLNSYKSLILKYTI